MNQDDEREREALLSELHHLRGQVRQLQAHAAQDATDSVRAALLVEAERIAHLGSWMWDLGTQQVFWSDEFFRILGMDPAVDTATAEAFFGAIHPEDQARVQELTKSSLESGVVAEIEFRVVRKNGEVRDLFMNGAFLRNADDQIVRMVGCCLDTTDQHHAQEEVRRFEAMLEIMEHLTGVGVFHWSSRGREKVYWSKEMYRIFEATEPLTEDQFLRRVVQDDLELASSILDRVHAEGTIGPWSIRIRCDQQVRHLILNAKVLNDHGDVGGTIVDITEKIERDIRLRQSQKMEALGRLAGGVAHDFNNLLTVIIGNASILGEQTAERQLAEEILTAATQAEALTHQLLSFSGNAVARQLPTELNAVTDAALVLIRRVLGEGVQVDFLPGKDLWPIDADGGQLHQVLMNLALNARDALPPGGRLLVSTRNVPAAEDSALPGSDGVELRVKDNGRGMTDAEVRRAFEPYFTTKAKQGSAGFGLANVYAIITEHRGTISVKSDLGHGTEVVMQFPRSEQSLKEPRFSAAPPESEGPRRKIILVVDDDEPVLRVVTRCLKKRGFQVRQATGLADARTKLDGSIALLLTDIVLGDGNGTQLGREARELWPSLRISYMSGHAADTEGKLDAPFLAKPFSADQLEAHVLKLLQPASSQAQE